MFPQHQPFHMTNADLGRPIHQSNNSASEEAASRQWQKDVIFGGDAGNNQLLVAIYFSEGANARVHSAPLYNTVAGTLHDQISLQHPDLDACCMSVSYWKDGEMPSAPGTYEFDITLDGGQQGHAVRMFLIKDVDQTTPVDPIVSGTQLDGIPTFQVTDNLVSGNGKAIITAVGAGTTGPTYVTGDFSDNQSNMENIADVAPRNPATPGGAFASAIDTVPDSNEDYIWDIKYGTASVISTVIHMLVPINAVP